MLNQKEIVVLHGFSYIYDGGQETFIIKTFKYISKNSEKKFKYIIVSLVDASNPELEKLYKENNIKLYKLKFVNRNINIKNVIINLLNLFELAKIIRKEKVDILYGHDFFSALIIRCSYILTFLQLYRVKKLYISLHNLLYWLKKPHNYLNKILSIFTHKIICVSNAVMEYSIKHDKINKKKYKLIYNGIDTQEFYYSEQFRKQIRSQYNIDEKSIVIGAIGTLSFRKGHHLLIKAFKDFNSKYSNSQLFIFGGSRNIDGDDIIRDDVYKLINDLDLNEKIYIVKPRLDIYKVYSMFDIYIMPSVVEGFGLSLVEAMACESLIIASDIPPFLEIIQNYKTGILFESENYSDLSRKLFETIALSENEKKIIKKNARNYVIDCLSSDVMGKNFAELYEDLN